MLRVVLDANVFVGSLLTKSGATAQVLDAWWARRFLLLISPVIIAEIQKVLRYPHIQSKYLVTEADISDLTELLEKDALVVPGNAPVTGAVSEDASDEIFLACALDGQADFIVSGDRHLLKLGEYRGIPVLTVREFLNRITSE